MRKLPYKCSKISLYCIKVYTETVDKRYEYFEIFIFCQTTSSFAKQKLIRLIAMEEAEPCQLGNVLAELSAWEERDRSILCLLFIKIHLQFTFNIKNYHIMKLLVVFED